MANPSKKIKVMDNSTSSPEIKLPSSILVKFSRFDGTTVGSNIEIPTDTSSELLGNLLNEILENADKKPFAFYVNDNEISDSLKYTLECQDGFNIDFEQAITIIYEPLAIHRVRPVTRCIETMPGHTDAVLHVSYSPNGERLASGGGDLTVRFWNVITSMPQFTCKGHKHHVLCTSWSPDGRYFISADRSGEIRVWDPTTGTQIGKELKAHTKHVTSLCFEPYHLNPSCSRFVSSSKDKSIIIWNIRSGRVFGTLYGHTDSVESVKWGGTGLIYSGSRDRTIKIWGEDENKQYFKLIRTLTGHAHRINSIALNCDYVLRTGPFRLGFKTNINTGDSSATTNTNTKKTKRKNRDTNESETATSDNNDTQPSSGILDTIDNTVITDANMEENRHIAYEKYMSVVGQEGEKLVSCSDDFTIILWNAQHGKDMIARMTGHQNIVNHISFSPDGRFLASASFDKKIKLWCGRTGKFLNTLTGHVGSVYQVAWSPDSAYLVSASKDSTVKTWSMKNIKTALYTCSGHEDEVYALDWSPGSSLVASGSKDRTIKIWGH